MTLFRLQGMTYNEVRQQMAEEEEQAHRNAGTVVDGKTSLGFLSLGLEVETMQ